jgi:PBP1b-binding outer membrane lipoprotein LpoB
MKFLIVITLTLFLFGCATTTQKAPAAKKAPAASTEEEKVQEMQTSKDRLNESKDLLKY